MVFLCKDKAMNIEKLIKGDDEVNNATLRMADDFHEHLGELIHMAEEKEAGKRVISNQCLVLSLKF